MYIDSTYFQNTLVTWIRDQDDELHQLQYEPPYYCYTFSPDGEYQTIYGERVTKFQTHDFFEFKRFVDKKERVFESDIAPLYKHLSDEFYRVEGGPLHIGLFDIEVEVDLEKGEGYPTPDNPYGEVNSICLYDKFHREYHLFLLRADTIKVESKDGLPVKHHYSQSEVQLLNQFLDQIEDIDVLSAWYGDGFDINYLVKRIQKVLSTSALEDLCRGGFTPQRIEKQDDYGNDIEEFRLIGRPHLDMLKLYKKFTFYAEKPSFKLDTIAEIELGENKIEYPGDLGELYRNDPQTFFEYSLHDVYLLKELDEHLQHIDLAITMCREATIKFTDIFGSIKYIEQAIRNYCHYDRDPVLILPDKDIDSERGQLPGAIVYKTREGVHRWCATCDLTSLYPSVIVSLGISPETMLMQCFNHHDDFLKIVEQRDEDIQLTTVGPYEDQYDQFILTGKELHEVIVENGYTLSANGTIFSGEHGIVSEVVKNWFDQRVQLKQKMKQAVKDGDKEKEKLYDIQQMVKKISANSIYGAMGNQYCRFFDIDIARSITYTGQEISRYQTYMTDQIISEEVNATEL